MFRIFLKRINASLLIFFSFLSLKIYFLFLFSLFRVFFNKRNLFSYVLICIIRIKAVAKIQNYKFSLLIHEKKFKISNEKNELLILLLTFVRRMGRY